MDDNKGHKYLITTSYEHMVSEYTGLNMLEVEELNCIDYFRYRRDAFIHSMNQTEKGREYLDNAYRLEQTKPDRDSLRSKFGKR